MKLQIKIIAVAALALVALVFVWGGSAAASAGPECTPGGGFVPRFCVTVPAGPAIRRETTVALGFGRKPNRGPSGRGGHPRRRGTSRRGSSRSRRGAGRARLREEFQRAPPRPALRDAEELRAGHRGALCVSLRRRANRRGVVRRDRR